MSVSAPVIEEIFFRGLLYRALRNRMSVLPAGLIDGVVFGAAHGLAYPVDTLPPRMVFGLITCLLYERTGSLYPSIALHGLIDGAAFAAATTGKVGIAYGAYGAPALIVLAYAVFYPRAGAEPRSAPPPGPASLIKENAAP